MGRILWTIVVVLLIAGGAYGGWWWYSQPDAGSVAKFRLAPVQRGEILVTIGATGTLEPEEVIDVGAQIAGQILDFGKDVNGKKIDYGSVVDKDSLLAQIDASVYAADVASAQAQLEQDKAGITYAEANLIQLQAKLDQATSDWNRAQKLGPSDALAQESFDAYRAAFETAKANVKVGEAAILQAKAVIPKDNAAVERAQRNVSYCTIKSPVKGVIIDRRVNIGQTVVSSLSASSLFLLAKDLTHMQLWAPVNEADIGQIHPDQPVTFTVDAFPNQVFTGKVIKVRLNATMTQNVVTYVVEIVTDNSDGKLLPYLTANVKFETGRKPDVLQVPNAALRWTPATVQIAPDIRAEYEKKTSDTQPSQVAQTAPSASADGSTPTSQPGSGGSGRRSHSGKSGSGDRRPKWGKVWIQDGTFVRPIKVKTGLTDGISTEVASDDLKDDMQVIVGEVSAAAAANGTKNPFAVQAPPGGGGGGRGR